MIDRELIPELYTTEICYARVTVRLEHPDFGQSRSSAMQLDKRVFDDIPNLTRIREEMEIADSDRLIMLKMDYDRGKESLDRAVAHISNQIAWHLLRHLAGEVDK